ncbi:type VII secretion protein EccB [Saccharopolyspora phatthalungensis]|uniref:Type VII secretion protein EccB n=1 Tax=Saccharopolyspora phatthalungensis TaxID=664693 RepID=A0A840PX37_9PSEU|nr:type VII secretion protein EccB [Saccharopolyspora phatthalungensis]MBB5152474.1 type VII secretion protein EccB [Saccharopolyspora phatthalungensis]
MHSRSDQVQAHSFMTARLVAALVRAEPDMATPPLRRTPVGMVIGFMLAVLIVAGFAVVSMIWPGGATQWTQPGTLVVEKETGTRYVLANGVLHPVYNLASARLLLGAKMTVASTPQASLAGVPRGTPIGIIGAPDSLPDPQSAGGSWLVCAGSTMDQSGSTRPVLSLGIGSPADAPPIPDDRAVLVRVADGTDYLAWHGRRLKVTAPWVGRALGYSDNAAIRVRDAWVNALPAGPDLGALQVPGQGQPGPVLDGDPSSVGQVFVVDGVGVQDRYFVLTRDGLLPVTKTGAAMALGNPATAAAYGGGKVTAKKLTSAALASATVLPAGDTMAEWPPAPPDLMTDRKPCVRAVTSGHDISQSLVAMPKSWHAAPVDGPGLARTALTADRIAVQPGSGMLVRTMPAPGTDGAGLYLIAEPGAKFPVADEKSAEALGYSASSAIGVPASLLDLLPTGPVLSGTGGG